MQPGIFIDFQGEEVRIRQQPPPVLTALRGQRPARALAAAETVGVRERLLAPVLDAALLAEALETGQAPEEPLMMSVAAD